MSPEAGMNADTAVEEAAAHAEALTMEDLYKEAVDNKQADEQAASLLDPAGSYRAPLEGEKMLWFPRTDGRKGATIVGIGEATIKHRDDELGPDGKLSPKAGTEELVRTRIRVPLSWELVKDKNNPDRPDYAYRMYLAARSAFQTVIGEKPETIGHLIEFLCTIPCNYRVIQIGVPTKKNPEPSGEPGTMVVGITGVKQ